MHVRMTTSRSGFDVTPLPADRVTALATDFSPDERQVILHQGTERTFCGLLLDNKQPGVYVCRLCGLPLFKSDAKFESGTGWPSFFQAFDPDHVAELTDMSHGMMRVEIRCKRCDAHLGHVVQRRSAAHPQALLPELGLDAVRGRRSAAGAA